MGPGITRDAALRQAAKATGKAIEQDARPLPPPGCIAHVWRWFTTLLPFYAAGALLRPAGIKKDIEARFGLSPTVFEIGLLLDLYALWRRQAKDAQQG